MKKLITIIVFTLMFISVKGQFITPMTFTDTAEAEEIEKPDNQPSEKPAEKPVVTQDTKTKDSIDIESKKADLEMKKVQTNAEKSKLNNTNSGELEKTELEIRRLELQAQKFKLEQEIAALQRKDSAANLTPEEKIILEMKNNNLKLLLEKEKLLLEQELEEMKKDSRQEQYPSGVVYGHQFFRDKKFKYFTKTDEIVATEGYVLGTGDVVQLEVWGYRYWSKAYVVSESGAIDIAGYQKVFVKGLSLKKARELIGSRLGLGGTESSYSVTVTRPRMVTVNIIGDVFNPGTYTLPATNSAFNALVSMGGPSNTGSVRNIYIKRDGKIRDSFDVYEYFKDINHQQDVYLQNNDYVIVGPLNSYCTIGGSIVRPGNYEVKKGEGILDLINFAGGYFPDTYLKDIVVSRVYNNKYEVISVNLDSLIRNKKDFKLYGGENIQLKNIVKESQNLISVSGAVSVPGVYRLKPGMKISDLLKTANGLTNEAYNERGYLIRTNTNNTKSYFEFNPDLVLKGKAGVKDIPIGDKDEVYIFFKSEFEKKYRVSISGPVLKPMDIGFITGQKLSQLIYMAGGLKQEADLQKGFIVRTNFDKERTLIPFIPEQVLKDSSKYDIELMPRDEVLLYVRGDFEFKQLYDVSINGNVHRPLSMAYTAGLTMGDLVRMAGGFTEDVDMTKGFIIRSNTERDKKIIEFEPGKIVEGNPEYKMEIQPRDAVIVYSRLAYKNTYSVSINGAVNNPLTTDFAEGMRLGDLVHMAGDLTLDADSTKGFIIRTNLDNYKTLIPFEAGKIYDGKSVYDIKLDSRDVITIFSKRPYKRYYNLSIEGPVKDPKTMAFSENTTVKDLVDLAGGLELWAHKERALVVHTDLETGYKTIRTVKLDSVLLDPSRSDNYKLEENDVVRVFDLSELRNEFNVSIFGEVRRSGDYPYADNITLQNVIDMAGGFQFISAGTTIEVVRNFYFKNGKYKFLKPEVIFSKIADNLTIKKEIQNYVLQPFDRIFVRRNPDFMPLKMIYIDGAIRYPGLYALQAENEKVASVYNRAGGFRADANIRGITVKRARKAGDTIDLVLNSRKAIHRHRSKYNVILKGGDYIYVPYAENLVTITGDVNKMTANDLGVFYTRNKRAIYYIRNFGGGFTETSDKKHVIVQRANGARVSTHRFLFVHIYPKVKPGSKIVVTKKMEEQTTAAGRSRAATKSFQTDAFLNKLLTRMTAVLSLIGLYRVATAK